MIVFPNCKINLGLNITSKRADGYHNLETVFLPINLRDVLEIIRGEKSAEDDLHYSSSGIHINEILSNNICVKAYNLLKKEFSSISPVKLHLHKAIPIGAGLGGGSSDGAFTLKLLNNIFKLDLSTDQLIDYALQLGSDCPFFIINKPCFATSRGEMLEEIDLDLSAYTIVIVNPNIHISTATAFSKIKPTAPAKSIKEIIKQPIESWKNELKNDFEETVFALHPEVGEIKRSLYENGALYAAMSGTGSTVFGIFKKTENPVFNFPKEYFVYSEMNMKHIGT